MIIQGKVVSVALDVDYPKKNSDEMYKAFILKYVNGRNEVRDIIKPMAGLKFKPSVTRVLRELNAGDSFSVQIEKNKAGYDDIVALTKGEPTVEMAAQSAEAPEQKTDQTYPARGNKYEGRSSNTYETPEERKLKQRLIVRQSSVDQARQIVGAKAKVEDIFPVAEQIENWVYRGQE